MTKKLRSGFTLIETIIVVVIILILSAVAIPKFKHLLISNRLQEVSWQMVQDLRETREDAILYQQDLRIYFCTSPAEDRNFYFFETFQKDPLHSPPIHYNVGDTPDGKHFIKRKLKNNIYFGAHCPFTSFGWVDGREYYYLTFHCGTGSYFRGQPSAFDTITFKDPQSEMKFYVIVDAVGRARMTGQHP